jgi:hypothetical protein
MICWYAVSCDPAVIADRRGRCPWYRPKATPSPADMHAALRAALAGARIRVISPGLDQAPQITSSTLTSEAEAA